jgi:Fic family protein
MFVPEYTITSEILKNIASIEYSKAIIESQTVLPHWEKQLQKEANIRTIKHSLGSDGYVFDGTQIKKYLDKISKSAPKEIKTFTKALETMKEISHNKEVDEVEIKNIHRKLTEDLLPNTKQGRYRSTKLESGTNPEEILAEIVELFDWYNSLDAQEAHPIITSGIILSQMEKIKPFDAMNSSIAKITTKLCLKVGGYGINDYYCLEEFFDKNKYAHSKALDSTKDDDLTKWLEYFTDVMAREISNIKEQVMLLARDTKLAKASGRIELTERQERIVEFLQDYGLLQNRAFPKLFPGVSEDSILRDLKLLIDKDIVVKRGKTKSSRYELK